jgi:hypothetical protein
LATPSITALYGTTFVQHEQLGVASYHFESPSNCYISYASAPALWRLDDGSALPEKKPFTNTSYEAETRTFKGVVEWDPPFAGETRWEYEMVFSDDFAAIVSGAVHTNALRGDAPTTFLSPWDETEAQHGHGLLYLRWTPAPTSIFGIVYVQGFAYAALLEGLASYHFESPTNCYISYASAPALWRLDDGSALPEKKPFTNTSYEADTRTFKGVVEWDPPFAGETRWEYEMVFSDDFNRVVGGSMTASSGNVKPFADPARARGASRGSLLYVRKPAVLMQPELMLAAPLAETE